MHPKSKNTFIFSYIAYHHIVQYFSNDSMDESVSLNPCFPRACSALIGQMAQSVVIGYPHKRATVFGGLSFRRMSTQNVDGHYANVLTCGV